MGLIRKIKEIIDPINRMTAEQIVFSMPAVWIRVPICICAAYYESKSTDEDTLDIDAMAQAIADTDVHIYGREPSRVKFGAPFQCAINILAHEPIKMSDIESIKDATYALLIAELVKGGTNITENLAIRSAGLGYSMISQPLIEEYLSEGFPPDEHKVADIVHRYFEKVLSI